MSNIRTSFFTGVNAGYSDQTIGNHSQAVSAVERALSFIKRSGGGNQAQYITRPAFVVYDPALSCPAGGEIAVAVTTDEKLSGVIGTVEKLRAELEQSSLSVSGAPEEGIAITKGLKIETRGDFAALAKLWQDKATEVKNTTVTVDNPHGTYVSVAVANLGNGDVLIQGEANPRYFPTDASKLAWEEAAKKVISTVEIELGQPLNPEFRDLSFNYLRAKDRVNSRGESN